MSGCSCTSMCCCCGCNWGGSLFNWKLFGITEQVNVVPLVRSTARDRPSPYGETETASPTVARGPSPATRAGERVSPANARPERKLHADKGFFSIAAWRGTGPRPTKKAENSTARDRPSPYEKTRRFHWQEQALLPYRLRDFLRKAKMEKRWKKIRKNSLKH